AIAHDFTLQPGIPLIRVDAAACSGGTTTLSLAQREFTKDRPDKVALKWQVPVIAQAVGGAAARTLVSDGKATLAVPGCGPVVVNAGQSGYYRTLYAPALFAGLRDSFAKLAPIDQLGLMDDSWAEGMAGLQPVSDFLDLTKATPADADPEIWADVAGSINSLDFYYRGDKARQARFRKFAIARLSPVFERLGWQAKPGESAPTGLLRMQLIGSLGSLGDPAVLGEARRRYAAQATDPKAIPPELRKIIYDLVASRADAATWDKLHAEAKAEKTPLIKDQLYALLSISEDDALAQRALELALTDEPGATNSARMIGAVGYQHPDMAFDFAVAHRAQVDKLVDETSASRFYPALGGSSFDPAMIGKIKAFSDAHIAASSRRVANTVIANITYRMMVRNKRLPAVDAWLTKNGG
ncbi:MAG: ERAP1-like C-terminal domain-containing protein, partial [Rhodanobacter sp.]